MTTALRDVSSARFPHFWGATEDFHGAQDDHPDGPANVSNMTTL